MWGGFSASKLKPQLKMAVSRIQIAANKKSALLKQNMREVACLLAEDPPKEEKAKIRAEALIRDDNLIEAYEILQLECELLYERIKLIEFSKECPADLVPVISTLIWASHRVDIPELSLMKKQFRAKYGKKFEDAALSNVGGCLNERVVTKLSVDPPAAYLVQTYLERICEQYEVQWTPKIKLSAEQMIEPMAPPVGYSVPIAQGTGLGHSVGGGVPVIAGTEATYNNADEEINYAKQNGGIPPPAPNTAAADATLPSATATLYEPTTGISARFLNPPQEPQPPPASAGAGDFEEVDIFVPPGAPSAPPGSVVAAPQPGPKSPSNETATSTVTMGSTENNKKGDCCNDHDDNDHDVSPLPPPAPGASSSAASSAAGAPSSSSTYEDLAARFNQLKK